MKHPHPSRPETEKLLRANGFSSRQAKKILAGGWRLISEKEDEDYEVLELLDQVKQKLNPTK